LQEKRASSDAAAAAIAAAVMTDRGIGVFTIANR
jgi:hypothetical protein